MCNYYELVTQGSKTLNSTSGSFRKFHYDLYQAYVNGEIDEEEYEFLLDEIS